MQNFEKNGDEKIKYLIFKSYKKFAIFYSKWKIQTAILYTNKIIYSYYHKVKNPLKYYHFWVCEKSDSFDVPYQLMVKCRKNILR